MINTDKKYDVATALVRKVLGVDVTTSETGKNGEAYGISFYYNQTGCDHTFYSLTDVIGFVIDHS